jgi:hypothetical protein
VVEAADLVEREPRDGKSAASIGMPLPSTTGWVLMTSSSISSRSTPAS